MSGCAALQIAPDWERLTAHIESDEESKSKLGWVREMYAWSVGAALQVTRRSLIPPMHSLCDDAGGSTLHLEAAATSPQAHSVILG